MTSLAREFNQENLTPINKIDFRHIKIAIERNNLLAFSKDAYMGGDKKGWYMKTEQSPEGKYLLVEHYTPKECGGLELAYKADTEMLKVFFEKYVTVTPHLRQLWDKRFYQGEHKDKPEGSRMIMVNKEQFTK